MLDSCEGLPPIWDLEVAEVPPRSRELEVLYSFFADF